jgi:hypothetical protein
MAEETGLRQLVLGYCLQVGALVDPPAYGIHEVLLPEEVAARWRVDPLQRFAFSSGGQDGQREVTRLHYGHALVEEIINELRQRPANAHFYINIVRLEKPGLTALIEKSFRFPNARLFSIPEAQEKAALYDIVRFNFKVNLVSDEKRELIKPVWMNLQAGFAVDGAEIERQAILERENRFPSLDRADPTWRDGSVGASPLSASVLTELMERARQAVMFELTPNLESMERRMRRFLELDRARLQAYYDDLEKDLKARAQRASGERRTTLAEKLLAVAEEREIKLADAEQKYRIQVELELINLAVISQPKIELEVNIKKRTCATERVVVWDPLLHQLDPLACDHCGQPGENLWLCEGGHLAHDDCLAPQCVDCKRTYCQLCAEKVHQCAVCDQPVCVQSLNRCKICDRETCQTHAELCHAQNGQPRRIQAKPQVQLAEALAVEESKPRAESRPTAELKTDEGKSTRKTGKQRAPARPMAAAAKKTAGRKKESGPKKVTGQAVEVYVETARPGVSAYVFNKGRQVAARHWELAEGGILVQCVCEKGWWCPANNKLYRPGGVEEIEKQILFQINQLKQEYQVPAKKISYFRESGDKSFPMYRLTLFGMWKDAEILAEARRKFDHAK